MTSASTTATSSVTTDFSAASTTNSVPSQQQHPKHNVVPSEVGWQFVPQYYTFVNKQPNRLHCFYTKHSTFIHGTEGEDGTPCYGQQEIHQKILSLGFEGCKVYIHSVDAQASANNGIIVQVIGEISNRGEHWRKFVQTFFLAEQPNGYYVLNDIFRFLKEETVEEEEFEGEAEGAEQAETQGAYEGVVEAQQQIHAQVPPPPPPAQTVEAPAPQPEPPAAPVKLPTPAPPSDRAPSVPPPARSPAPKAATPVPEPAPEVLAVPPVSEQHPPPPAKAAHMHGHPNGHAGAPAEDIKENDVEKKEAEKENVADVSDAKSASAEVSETRPVMEKNDTAPVKATTPALSANEKHVPAQRERVQTPAQQQPSQPSQQQKPRSWATMAAVGAKNWGSNVAQEGRGTSLAAPSPPASTAPSQGSGPALATGTQTPPAGGQTPQGAMGGQQGKGRGDRRDGRDGPHPFYTSAMALTTKQVFIKGVQENVSESALRRALESFGPLDSLEIVRSKGCAFAEYTSLDAAKRAIVNSLPSYAGGDGGIDIPVTTGGASKGGSTSGGDAKGGPMVQRINVETKKERGERPPPRGNNFRGGARGGGAEGARGAAGGGRGAARGR